MDSVINPAITPCATAIRVSIRSRPFAFEGGTFLFAATRLRKFKLDGLSLYLVCDTPHIARYGVIQGDRWGKLKNSGLPKSCFEKSDETRREKAAEEETR